MCGFSGIFHPLAGAEAPMLAGVRAMTGRMVRRGPDDEGYWTDGQCCALGFRRLAILDLTPAGHQPMVSGSGRSVIVFNGELYNFRELRAELEGAGVRFRSRSDTEVVLEALEHWGEAALERFNGMFALAWYSIPERALVLARDHAGIKPLYYREGPEAGRVSFASQLNCLVMEEAGGEPAVREDALGLYLRLNYFPAPYTLYRGIHQVPAGCAVRVEAGRPPRMWRWWSLPESPAPAKRPLEELDERVEAALANAVRRQRVADVPVGVFLSGGVDSPLVTAVAAGQCGRELKAFTIGTPEWSLDETEDARRYAELLEVTQRLECVREAEALEMLDEVAEAQTGPFADYSMLPTMLVSRLARREVTVALSGDGGDELFFGYERPFSLAKGGLLFRYPYPIRWFLYKAGRLGVLPERSSVIMHRTPGDCYFSLHSHFPASHWRKLPAELRRMPEDFTLYRFSGEASEKRLADFSRTVEYSGQLQRVLRKVDMASMHYSLEVRVPVLDREVIEASLAYDGGEELRQGMRKRALRRLLAKRVGEENIPKPKRGFGVPLSLWLRGALRARVEEELLGNGSWACEVAGRDVVRDIWEEHASGRRSHHWAIYSLLALQWWKSRQVKVKTPAGART